MCLAVPLQIESIEDQTATVALSGSRTRASLALTPQAKVGDWVLVHAGFAIAVLDAEQAKETFDVLREAND